jgi:large subunit ribosomal protein L16
MLMPRREKHRKVFRGKRRGLSHRGDTVAFGDYGIQSLEAGWVTGRQIEAARRAITNYIRRGGKVWIRIFPDKPVTQKPAETRMGKGKGNPEYHVAVVRPGRIMFELAGVPEDVAMEALRRASMKMPMRTKIVAREVTGRAVSGGDTVAVGD